MNVQSFGRGGDDLCIDGCVERKPGMDQNVAKARKIRKDQYVFQVRQTFNQFTLAKSQHLVDVPPLSICDLDAFYVCVHLRTNGLTRMIG